MNSVNYAKQLDLIRFSVPDCTRCGSHWVVKDGKYKRRGKHNHRYRCKRCGYRFVIPKADNAVKAWAVHMYTKTGITLKQIAEEVKRLFEVVVSHTTIRNWMLRTTVADNHVPSAKGAMWHVDETVIHSNKEKWWIWIVLDRESRCVLAWHVSNNRGKKNAKIVLQKAMKTADGPPAVVVSDGYRGYASVINKALGRYKIMHIIESAFGLNALIERVNREIKKRLKWFKCNVSRELVETLLALWFHDYHHRFHCGLGCSPLEASASMCNESLR